MPIKELQELWQGFRLRLTEPPPEPWRNRVPPWVRVIGGLTVAGAALFGAGALMMKLHG